MKVWGLISTAESEILKSSGLLRIRFSELDFYDRPEHLWLFREACERLGPPPAGGLAPLWGWSQWRGEAQKRPDMRFYRNHLWDAPVVRIELDIPDHLIVQFDLDLLENYLLFNFYLPASAADDKRFYKKVKNYGLDDRTAFQNLELAGEIQSSWDRIFDLSLIFILSKEFQWQETEQSIAAMCWEYRREWLKRMEVFDFTKTSSTKRSRRKS